MMAQRIQPLRLQNLMQKNFSGCNTQLPPSKVILCFLQANSHKFIYWGGTILLGFLAGFLTLFSNKIHILSCLFLIIFILLSLILLKKYKIGWWLFALLLPFWTLREFRIDLGKILRDNRGIGISSRRE